MSSKSSFNPFSSSAREVKLQSSKPAAPAKNATPPYADKSKEAANLFPGAMINTQQPHHTASESSQASAVRISKISPVTNAPPIALPKTKNIHTTITPKSGSVGAVSSGEAKPEWNRELTEREQHAVALGKAFFKNAMT